MTWLKWLPWRWVVRRVARRQGFIDPIALLGRLHAFAQPSEVGEPIELLRAGVVFHARGLINSRVIQHNLDWVWPWWIERQFDPTDVAFIPRAFSITHVNLSHRNWTAIGLPDSDELPIVDPRGLLTPLLDGWSLDGWVLAEDGSSLLPSRASQAHQRQQLAPDQAVITECEQAGLALTSRAWVEVEAGQRVCKLQLTARADRPARLILSLRPANPEGVSFVHDLTLAADRAAWTVNGEQAVRFSRTAERHHVSDYHGGDVFIHLADREDQDQGHCEVGMVTAAALFPLAGGEADELTVTIPLEAANEESAEAAWRDARQGQCRLRCPEPRYQRLFDEAVTSLLLHSPDDVYPGPYTYKRFWFRDAAFIIHALLCLGLTDRARRALDRFADRQTVSGYFRSQEGEWDANGEVLWIWRRYLELTGEPLPEAWRKPVERGARWIIRKRLPDDGASPHAGLLPAGFSAEHLGPNDYYYWDDFWGIAGLEAAATLLADRAPERAEDFDRAAADFRGAVERSLARRAEVLGRPGMPASPNRRLDAGAIGSLAFGYPVQLCAADDPRLLDCVDFLLEHCFVKGAFYQDMIHSGLNAYLTLQVAQVLLRAGDPRYLALMDSVADLASSTGQWPEAIHPHTGGGCMGDGHHVWASAEWALMIRHCFVREEGDRLVVAAGIPQRWLEADEPIEFGPAPTRFGRLTLRLRPEEEGVRLQWQADWHGQAPELEVRLAGHAIRRVDGDAGEVMLSAEVEVSP